MIWKGLGVLLGAAGVVAVGVFGLAWLTIPDEPSFAEGLASAAEGNDGSLDFVPTAIGGELTVTGAREGTIVLDQMANGPSFGLGNSKTRIFFQGGPLAVSQLDHDGLSFFLDPEECQFTVGEHNEDAGLAAVQVSCPELVDIRGNGTLAVEGYLALPADLVLAEEIPETGGTITVGDEEWVVVDPMLVIGDRPATAGDSANGLWLTNPEYTQGVFLAHDEESDTLRLTTVTNDEGSHGIESGSCTIGDEVMMVLNPEARLMELTLSCQGIEVPGMGTVNIDGTVTYDKIYLVEG